MTNKNNAIAAAAGEAAARETRSRQSHVEAERRLQSLRSNAPARSKQNDAADAMQSEGGAPDPAIGPESLLAAGLEIISAATAGDGVGSRPRKSGSKGGDFLSEETARGDDTIIGSGDRAHDMAFKSGHSSFLPRPAPARRPPLLPSLRPTSRAECGRRCGKAGFCDPSSELGCGGEYCGNHHEMMPEQEIAPRTPAPVRTPPSRGTREDERKEIE